MRFDDALRRLDIPADAPLDAARSAYVDRAEHANRRGRRKLHEAWRVVRAALSERESTPRTLGPYRTAHATKPPTAGEVRELVASRKPRAAARALAELYEAAAGLDTEVLSPREALELIFRLHERNAVHLAARLSRSLQRWLASSDDDRLDWRPASSLARELAALPASLSVDVRVVLARAARTGDVRAARMALEDIQRRDPTRTRRDARSLREHAPLFKDWFEGALDPKPPPPPAVRRSARPWMVLMILIAQAVFAITRARSPYYTTPQYAPSEPRLELSQDKHAVARRSVQSLADESAGVDVLVENTAHALGLALERHDCPAVRSNVALLRLREGKAESLRGSIELAIQNANAVCGELAPATF